MTTLRISLSCLLFAFLLACSGGPDRLEETKQEAKLPEPTPQYPGAESEMEEGKSRKTMGLDLSSPFATLATLVKAIRARDLSTYEACFSQKAHDRGESMLSNFHRDPEGTWSSLEKTFRGPQTLKLTSRSPDLAKGVVDAPEAGRRGIGSMLFERDSEGWRVRAW